MFQRISHMLNIQSSHSIFDFDDKRTELAKKELLKLCEITHIQQKKELNDLGEKGRSICISHRDNMTALRQSPYYLKIKQRHDNGELLVPAELYYFAMTTDDVSKLSLSALENIPYYFHSFPLDPNFNVLLSILKLTQETHPAARNAMRNELREIMITRISRYADHHNIIHYLNLSGAKITDVNLNGAELRYVDFTGADLSRCKVSNTDFYCCNLSNANLSNLDCVRPKDQYYDERIKAPSIHYCLVMNACLDGMQATDPDPILCHWNDSDFTGASMRNMKLYVADFNNSILDDAKIENSTILFAGYNHGDNCSMHRTSLAHSSLHGTNFKCVSEDTRLLSDDAMQSTSNLATELADLHAKVSQKVKPYVSPQEKSSQLAMFKTKLATSLVYQIQHAEISDDEKSFLLQCAIGQPVFQPENSMKSLANTANHMYMSVGAMFSSTSSHNSAIFTTPSMDILEEALKQSRRQGHVIF